MYWVVPDTFECGSVYTSTCTIALLLLNLLHSTITIRSVAAFAFSIASII